VVVVVVKWKAKFAVVVVVLVLAVVVQKAEFVAATAAASSKYNKWTPVEAVCVFVYHRCGVVWKEAKEISTQAPQTQAAQEFGVGEREEISENVSRVRVASRYPSVLWCRGDQKGMVWYTRV